MAQSGHIVQIFKSRNNILALLSSQGYDVSDYTGSSISEVHSMQRAEQMDMLVTKKDGSKKAYVKYHSLAKTLRTTGSRGVYEYIYDLFDLEEILTKKDDLIIIVKDEPNDPLVKALRTIWEQDGVFVTVFNIQRLQFNILEHSMVPPHRILNPMEAQAVKKRYNISDPSQVPDISRFSPVAQAIGMRPGEMCEILRPSKTAISTLFYRICSS